MNKKKVSLFFLFLIFVLLISGCTPKQPSQPPQPQVWQKTFGGDNGDLARSIQQTSDGGYIVAGDTKSFGVGGYDVYILKLDEDGNLIWQKTFGGSNDDWAKSIQQTSDGGYIVAGYTSSFGAGDSDVYILKLTADGNLIWQKILEEVVKMEHIQFNRQAMEGILLLGGHGPLEQEIMMYTY